MMKIKLIILLCTVVFYQTSIILCIEMDAQNNMGKGIHDNYHKDFPKARLQDVNIQYKEKLKYLNKETKHIKAPKKDTDKYGVGHIQNKLSKDGIFKIKSTGYIIKERVDPNMDINLILINATNRYFNEIIKYFDFIRQQNVTHDLDVEYYYLDIVDSIGEIFKTECYYLRDNILAHTKNKVTDASLELLERLIALVILNEKQESLKFMCEHYKICRPFPTYIDRVADFISEMQRMLNNDMLLKFINAFKEIVGEKILFFRTFMNHEMEYKIRTTIKPIMCDVAKINELLSNITKVFEQRHKLFTKDGREINKKTKAMRILLDVIDKAFDDFGDHIAGTVFDELYSKIEEMVAKGEGDISNIIHVFVNSFVYVLSNNLPDKAKEEVKVLIDIIGTGSSGNVSTIDYLFKSGSQYVKYDKAIDDLYNVHDI